MEISDLQKMIDEIKGTSFFYFNEIVNLIKSTGKVEEYLIPETAKKFEFSTYEISKLIKETGNIEKYLLEGQKKDDKHIRFSIANLIKATGRIEEYLTPEKIKKFDIDDNQINQLIKETGNVEKYLLEGQSKEDVESGKLELSIINIIKATGKIEEYLVPEKIGELCLEQSEITDLIKETGNIEKYLLEGQSKEDVESGKLKLTIENIIKSYLTGRQNLSKEKIILPNNMTIGIEIETQGNSSNYLLYYYINIGEQNWNCKMDGSLIDEKYKRSGSYITNINRRFR